MKPIFEYIDYRRFLHDLCEHKKRENRRFSFRSLMMRATIGSPNFIQQVIAGKRNLTAVSCDKLAHALKLSEKEALFFSHLVKFNQARTALQKQEHYMVLVALMKNVRHYRLTADQYEYFGTWYASVIRELLCMRNFGNNFSHLAQALIPPIKPTEARRAVRLLERLKLVTKRNDGLYEQSHAAIRSTVGLAPQCIRNLNRQMLEFALQAIETFSKKERNISGMTLGISPATYDLLVAEIDAFKDRIESIVNRNDTANRVFQLNVQLFPLSREVDCDTNKKDGAQ